MKSNDTQPPWVLAIPCAADANVEQDSRGSLSPDVADGDLITNDEASDDAGLDSFEEEEEEEDFASTFVSAPSLPPAVQGTNLSAKPLRIQSAPHSVPGRTPIHGRPIILRDLRKHASSTLTQEETSRLLRSITQRDVSILQALHDYRYLNTLQIQQLVFPGIRSAQMRLQYLDDQGLLYRWPMIDPPGLTRRPSLLLLTPRGGRLLGELRGHSPWPYVRRAKDARDHCWHVTHDLEANGFFIDLALATRVRPDEGLLQWTGEESSRSIRRAWASEDRRPVATPDGAGLYLHRGRTICFDPEWDRGTESIARLRGKLRTYTGFYKNMLNADRHHVLFVLHRSGREETLHELVTQTPGVRRRRCRFWTTTVDRIDRVGPLGPLWAAAGRAGSYSAGQYRHSGGRQGVAAPGHREEPRRTARLPPDGRP